MREFLDSTICLVIDLTALGVVYILYRKRLHVLEFIQNAPDLEINKELSVRVRSEYDSTIPYAVVRGAVKAKEPPLRSKHLPDVAGVIRENVIRECKIRWSHASRLWFDESPEIHRALNFITFKLVGGGKIFGRASVEIADPLSATEIPLQTVYDHFTPSEVNFGGQVANWLRGEHVKGIHEVENMLLEGNEVTAIGELKLLKDHLVLKPPTDGRLPYILSYLSRDELVDRYTNDIRGLRAWCIILTGSGICIALWILYKWMEKRKKEKQMQALLKLRAERKRQGVDHDNIPLCVVCVNNPVEITVLECGHACLCAECADNIRDTCPVCRSHIARKVLIYLP